MGTSGDPKFMHLIEKSQGKTATLVGFHSFLVNSGHKNGAKAHQIDILDLLPPAMLDLSHINAWNDQQAPVKEGTSVFFCLYKLGPKIHAFN